MYICRFLTDKPRITVQSPVDATEPQSTMLNCNVDALPALTSLTWYKGGQLLDTSSTARYSGGTVSVPSLTIVKVGPADAGSYYCVASNSLGTTTSATITLTVQCKKTAPRSLSLSPPLSLSLAPSLSFSLSVN